MPLPILLFPGVMGSRLYFLNTHRYWDPDSALRMARWAPLWPFRSDDDNRKVFHFDEPAGVIVEGVPGHPESEELGWGGVVWSCYGRYLLLLHELTGGGSAFAVGYDWRQDLHRLGRYAADKIMRASAVTKSKVALVAHSMGGFVVRAAFRTEPELADRVAKVLFVCQPVYGAVGLYRRLFTGLMPEYDRGGGVLARAYRAVLGNNRAGFVGNVSGQPGTLALLPSVHFPRAPDGGYWHDALAHGLDPAQLYLGEEAPLGLSGPDAHPDPEVRTAFRQRLREVMETHEWLGEPVLPEPVEVWQLLGVGLATEVSVRLEAGTVVPRRTAAGDDTVPPASARGMRVEDPARTIEIPELSHATACRDPRVMEETRRIFSV
jgi:pimeloyl-ACP methyl ester carboxylesterase